MILNTIIKLIYVYIDKYPLVNYKLISKLHFIIGFIFKVLYKHPNLCYSEIKILN